MERLNLILDVANGDKVYIPQPASGAFEAISKVLRVFYKEIISGIPPEVIVTDAKSLIKEACEGNEVLLKNVNSFIDRTLSSSSYLDMSNGELIDYNLKIKSLDQDVVEYLEGTLLLSSALYRYATPVNKQTVLKDIVTSLDCTEWKNSFTKSTKS